MPPKKIAAPKLTPPSLTGIADAGPEVIGEDVDGLRIIGADLADLRLSSVTFMESELVDAVMRGTRLPGCRFLDVRLDRLDAQDLVGSGTKWRDSEILASRLGAVSLYDAEIDSLRLDACKIGFLNLRGASISDLMVSNCAIEELDLSEASLTRAAFPGCTIETLTLRNATLRHVDLRGATLSIVEPVMGLRGAVISDDQLVMLAPLLAHDLGIVVE